MSRLELACARSAAAIYVATKLELAPKPSPTLEHFPGMNTTFARHLNGYLKAVEAAGDRLVLVQDGDMDGGDEHMTNPIFHDCTLYHVFPNFVLHINTIVELQHQEIRDEMLLLSRLSASWSNDYLCGDFDYEDTSHDYGDYQR